MDFSTLLISKLRSLPRLQKKLIIALIDFCLAAFSLWLSFSIRIGDFFSVYDQSFGSNLKSNLPLIMGISDAGLMAFIYPLIAILLINFFGLYRQILRYLSTKIIYTLIKSIFISVSIWALIVYFFDIFTVPRSVFFINAFLTSLYLIGWRVILSWAISYSENLRGKPVASRMLIYGAGEAGVSILRSLVKNKKYNICGFIDDNNELQNRELMGYFVYPSNELVAIVNSLQVDEILIAMPSLSLSKRREIINRLRKLKVKLSSLPGISEISSTEVNLNDIKELDIDDLLDRDYEDPDHKLLNSELKNKIILISGGGGTIGSELCRQVLNYSPCKIILVEISEYALYSVHQELIELQNKINKRGKKKHPNTSIIPILASVQDTKKVFEIIRVYRPNIIYHAAAYKHVPMVEHNLSEGLKNNVFGTLNMALGALKYGVKDFVLVSTDKAVRPTNIMGASKRLSEIILQALAKESHLYSSFLKNKKKKYSNKTHYSMVRFGNVLGSSGSVVPLFRKQIKEMQPITLTDKNITRYFMSIKEAAQLIIHSTIISREKGKEFGGGDVYVLDMGKPVKIYDLATRMIELSGFTLKDHKNPDGDISIKITGLRPGEKLYEELLIGENPVSTEHKLIFKASEKFTPWIKLESYLDKLENAIQHNEIEVIRDILVKVVDGYSPTKEIFDWIYNQDPENSFEKNE